MFGPRREGRSPQCELTELCPQNGRNTHTRSQTHTSGAPPPPPPSLFLAFVLPGPLLKTEPDNEVQPFGLQ